ncbi:hypothetical protein ABPG74_007039 [Tetrahymena malaccensis]
MYSIGNNQLGGLPSQYNYLYQTSQILTQNSPYYYVNHQNQAGFHAGYSRDYQMGFQSGNHLMGLGSLNYISQGSSGQTQSQQQIQQLGQSAQLPEKQQQQQQQRQHHHHQNRNSGSHEKENLSKDRSIKRNNSNLIRDKSNEKLSFNKSTPHFFPQHESQNNYNSNISSGNYQSNNNSNNSGNVFMTNSNGNSGGNQSQGLSQNNAGSQTNLRDNDKINQIQKIYNNNIRSRNNFHKSQNNFYNTHSNTFFNSNSNSNQNVNNGSLDQRKKNNGNGLSSRLSQSPTNDIKMIGSQQNHQNSGQLSRKYYTSHQTPKYSSQASSSTNYPSQNQNPLTQFQKENNNLANIYSKDYKTNRNSLTKGLDKKDSLNQIYKPQIKAPLNLGNSTSKNQLVNSQVPVFAYANSQSKFYQTEPNFNQKPNRKSFTLIKPAQKSQLKPIEDLIMNENMSSQSQVSRKYFFNNSNNQNGNFFGSQTNLKWSSLTPKQTFSSSNAFSKTKKKEELIPHQKITKVNSVGSKKSLNLERDNNLDNEEYDYEMQYEEPLEQSSHSFKNPEQLYNYEIEIEAPLSQQLSKKKLLTQVEEESSTSQMKNIQSYKELKEDNQVDLKGDTNLLQTRESLKKEDKNSDLCKKDDDKLFQKYNPFSIQQSNYVEGNRKSNNNFELEVIQEQNKEDEIKEVPADLLQQVQKISEARPKTSEGGHRIRRLKYAQQKEQNQKLNNEQLQQAAATNNNSKDQNSNNPQAKSSLNKNDQADESKNNKEEVKQAANIPSRRKNQSNGSEMYDLIENSPKQLDFSPLKTSKQNNEKEDYSNNEYEEEYDDLENDEASSNLYNKNQFFRSQAEFYRPSYNENDLNCNQTNYGEGAFKGYNSTEAKKKNMINFRKTTNEGGFFNQDQENSQIPQQQPRIYNFFKKNKEQSYKQNVAPNGDIPIEVYVQEDDVEYIYQENSQRKKVFLKKKTIDTSDGHKIIIRHNKSAAGPKRVPKQQEQNVAEDTTQQKQQQQVQQQQQQQQQLQQEPDQKQIEPQDDVVERIVLPFKTGLDNEFINLFAQAQFQQ